MRTSSCARDNGAGAAEAEAEAEPDGGLDSFERAECSAELVVDAVDVASTVASTVASAGVAATPDAPLLPSRSTFTNSAESASEEAQLLESPLLFICKTSSESASFAAPFDSSASACKIYSYKCKVYKAVYGSCYTASVAHNIKKKHS